MDILDAPVVEEVTPTSFPSTKVVPDEELLKTAATLLAGAQKPMIFVGDGVAYSGAQDELTRVAELLGAEVWEADAGELNMSYVHPLYQGATGHMFGYQSLPILSRGDVNLVCGTYIVPEVFPALGNVFAAGAKVIHIDLNAYEIAKNHPVDLGMVSDPKLTLAKLAIILEAVMTSDHKEAARVRTAEIAEAKAARRNFELKADQQIRDSVPLHLCRFTEELATYLPEDAIIFDEAITNSPAITRYIQPTKPSHYFLTRGGSLGVGIPGAIGAKLANPDKTVIGFVGDGGAMYTIQALWSAARHNIDVKFVICNNRSYRILQSNVLAYWQERGIPEHEYPLSFDLSKPELRFDEMARSMGVSGIRVEKPQEIAPAIQKALAHKGPFLIDLVLEGDVHPDLIGVKCGQ
jgi:benzoylformate decarboxylase